MAGLESDSGTAFQGSGLLPSAQLKSARQLTNQVDALKRGRSLMEMQWKLNLAFYKGKQYAYYNKASKRIEQLPVEDGDKPRFRVRIVSNQIMSGCQSLLAKFTKTRPVMHATPGTGSDRDLKAAQMSEKLLEYWWTDFQMDDALEEAMLWAMVGGQGFWEVCWDEHAGKAMTFLVGPDGQPVTDPNMADAFRAQLNQSQVQPQEQTVYLGDIRVDVVSPFDLYLDPTVKKFSDAKYAFRALYLDPDTIKARWKVDLTPDSISASPDVTLPMANSENAFDKNVRKVMMGYFRPGPTMPKGRIVTWSGSTILEDKPWDYPTTDLPFVKFPGIRVPGEVYDSSVVEHAIPMQKELNRTLSQIVEYKNLTIKPRVWAPIGSLRQRLTNEPGAVYEFTPIGGLRPEIEQLPSMPPYVFEHLNQISQRLNDIFGLAQIAEGTPPPNVEAGIAIDLLQEMATDRLEPTIKLMELSLARAGRLMLSLAKHYYIEPRLLKIRGGTGATQVKEFSNSDIDGAVDVVCESGSGLPRTRAGRQARVEWLVQAGILPINQAYKYLDVADLTGMSDLMQLDEDQALRENDKIIAGTALDPDALQQAQQAVQQGVDPQSGQPIQNAQQAQQILMNAAMAPNMFDNHQVHMDIHGRFMKTLEYESLDEQIKQLFEAHMSQHFQILLSYPTSPEPVAPRVTYQIKSTAGPDIATQILKRSGVNVTPEQAAEPPLDTWVSDSLDKPNDIEGELDLPQAAQDMAQAQEQHEQALAQQQQQMQHDAEKHQQAMQQEAFKTSMAAHRAALSEQAARQGPAKPSGRQK